MATGAEDDDYWTNLTAAPLGGNGPDAAPALTVEAIEGAEPPTVVAELHARLSGGSKGEVYAVLDAAKVPGLPEMLEASDLEHVCLFQGQFEDDVRDVAPWLVKLSPDDPLTRNVFTAGDAPWHLWDRRPGIVVGAEADMATMRRHFRRFTALLHEAWPGFTSRVQRDSWALCPSLRPSATVL